MLVKLAPLSAGSLWGRVEEQCLWSSRQIGEQSPAALLRSLVYLNTKYFGLRTVEQHLRLSFANVYGPDTVHPVTKETAVCICVPSISQDHHGEAGGVHGSGGDVLICLPMLNISEVALCHISQRVKGYSVLHPASILKEHIQGHGHGHGA